MSHSQARLRSGDDAAHHAVARVRVVRTRMPGMVVVESSGADRTAEFGEIHFRSPFRVVRYCSDKNIMRATVSHVNTIRDPFSDYDGKKMDVR